MSDASGDTDNEAAPGENASATEAPGGEVVGYTAGLALAALLTVLSFVAVDSSVIWGPAIPAALIALAVAQMGVHLVFFLHINSGPDNTNNSLALAFGVFVVVLVMCGSIWIMGHLNHNMMPMGSDPRTFKSPL